MSARRLFLLPPLLLCALLGACALPSLPQFKFPARASTVPAEPAAPAPAPTAVAAPAEADPALSGPGHWRLVELLGKTVRPDADGRLPWLSFRADGAVSSGHTGCNNFNGPIELQASEHRLRFGLLGATRRACKDMKTEQQLLQTLARIDGYQIEGQQLRLSQGGGLPLARFEAAGPALR